MLPVLEQLLRALGVQGDPLHFLQVCALLLARCLAAVSFTPFLGGRIVPVQVRVGLSVALVVLLYPLLSQTVAAPVLSGVWLLALLAKEALAGAVLGLIARLGFAAVEVAGELIDTLRGMNQPAFFAPQLADRVSSLSLFKLQAALAVFFAFNGHLLFIQAIARSYEALPLTAFPAFRSGVPALAEEVAQLTALVLLIALQLAAPALIALFLTDLAFGIISRVASRIDAHDLSQPWKALVGLLMVLLTAVFFFAQFQVRLPEFLREAETLLRNLR